MITYERQNFGPADMFKDLRDRQVLFDGKIASDNPSEQSLVLRCHRVVLAAVSRPLENMFRNSPDSEQIVYIRCVGYNSLNYFLKLVYEGSVKVKDDEDEAFCAAMRSLAVRGLGKSIENKVYCLESSSGHTGLLKKGAIQYTPNVKREVEAGGFFRNGASTCNSFARVEHERPVREVPPTPAVVPASARNQIPPSLNEHNPRSNLPTLFGTRQSQDGPDIKVNIDVGGGRTVRKRMLAAPDSSSVSSFRANFRGQDHELGAAKRGRLGDVEDDNAFWLSIINPVSTTEHAVLDKYGKLGLVRFVGSFQADQLLYLRFRSQSLRAEAQEVIRQNEPVLDPRIPPPKWSLPLELQTAVVNHVVDLAGHSNSSPCVDQSRGRQLRLTNYNPIATKIDFCRLLRKHGFNKFHDNNVKVQGSGTCAVLFDDDQELENAIHQFHNVFVSGYKLTAERI